MKNMDKLAGRAFSCLACILYAVAGHAQNGGPAVLQWRSFLPYNQVENIATDGNTFYCATGSGFFTYNRQDGTLDAYSKANGMHDIGMTGVAYDDHTRTATLAYSSSNIDLFRDGQFYNIPDLKASQTSGDKTIHSVTAAGGIAYLSTGIGLVLVNLEKKEIKESVVFYEDSLKAPVYDAVIKNDSIYVATGVGIFRSSLGNSFLQDYATWDLLTSRPFHHLAFSSGVLYAAEADSVVTLQNNAVQFFTEAPETVTHLDAGNNGLWVSSQSEDQEGHGYLHTAAGQIIDSIPCHAPMQVLQLADGTIWYADNSNISFPDHPGLRKKIAPAQSESYTPDGPVVATSFDISAYNGELWVAHGGYSQNWSSTHNRAMFSHYQNGMWKNYPWVSDSPWVQDFIRILKDPQTGYVYAGSLTGGLTVIAPGGESWEVYNVGYLPELIGDPTRLYRVTGLALDDAGNLWISNNGTPYELTVKTPDGHWYNSLSIPENSGGELPHAAADVILDDYGQKWFITTSGNSGAVVYDDKGTLNNTSDDEYRILKTGEGNGNLPDNNTLSIAKDKDGAIWIGTANGIGIVSCPGDVIKRQCEATLKVVQFDQFADYLFVNQAVNAIAVDGANRKWIGTANGVWLISDDAERVIYRFTEDNSPLPSNLIRRINIDPVTGDVYFSTDKGIVSFRSTATEGSAENTNPLLIYPNPVPTGYQGMIAVRGVAENADVRFTDISGQLVYRTKAFGGQAVWDGKDYTGHKVQSGVYLVFVVNKDGTQKTTGKIIIQK